MGFHYAFMVFGKKISDKYVQRLCYENTNKNSNATISKEERLSLSLFKENKFQQKDNLLNK